MRDANPKYNEGLTLGKPTQPSAATLTEAQINQLLNIWVWKVPLTVPKDTKEISIYLEEYDGEERVEILAHHSLERLESSRAPRSKAVSDIVTIALRFTDFERSGSDALRTSQDALFATEAEKWRGSRLSNSTRFENPLYRTTGDSMSLGGFSQYIDPSLSVETDRKEYIKEVERIGRIHRTEFQVGLLSASVGDLPRDKGPSIRATFRLGIRFESPTR
ncbi:hypothetical protein N9B21_00475 [Verrucomicrobiales bacterium]|nr:hypothetical protein [Verrucomicrobiales bacterium]MDA7926493.1 hypothetical protein [Verrucomicrobiales bacterium]